MRKGQRTADRLKEKAFFLKRNIFHTENNICKGDTFCKRNNFNKIRTSGKRNLLFKNSMFSLWNGLRSTKEYEASKKSAAEDNKAVDKNPDEKRRRIFLRIAVPLMAAATVFLLAIIDRNCGELTGRDEMLIPQVRLISEGCVSISVAGRTFEHSIKFSE